MYLMTGNQLQSAASGLKIKGLLQEIACAFVL